MSNTKHTPEPWKRDDFVSVPFQFPKGERPVIMKGLHPHDFDRACQCVNACAGIDDPATFIRMVRELVARASRDGSILANSINERHLK